MADNGLGFSLEIPDKFLKDAVKADLAIEQLAKRSEESSAKIVSAFKQMTDMGVQPFLDKLNEANKSLSNFKIGNVKMPKAEVDKFTDSATKAALALNKVSNPQTSVSAWTGLANNITQLERKSESLVKSTKEYELTMSRIGSGKGGVVSMSDKASYENNLKEIESIRTTIASYKEKQNAIIAYQQEQKKVANNALALRNFESERTSLPEQRKADELKKMSEYYKALEISSKKANDAAIAASEKEVKATERKINAEKRLAESQERINRRQGENRNYREGLNELNAYNRAMAASEATITQRTNKIARLTQVEQQLSASSRNYSSEVAKIRETTDRLNKANTEAASKMEAFKKAQTSAGDVAGQLTRKLALVFSVSQIQGYVMNMIKVRGEFELQNRALQAILQNKDEADKLFGRITELAVRSPFQVKELVTYTKQLAAYRVETEKLYDTTKMLADVSAGLGVDMSRLILAYGQVKAANYLRGTELRQFSEAGINILGELATYYTELEGRMISVGDVQERVTKRMVAFGDVEEIFKRITSAGGIFYNMQEIQAETLSGQMSNLADSIDIMFNAIGKSNDADLKNAVGTVRELVENWREIAFVLKQVIVAFAAYKGATTLATIGNSAFTKSVFSAYSNLWIYSKAMLQARDNTVRGSVANGLWVKSLTGIKTGAIALGKGLASIVGAAVPLLLIGGMFELYRQMTAASRAAEVLKNNLDGIIGEDATNLDKQVDGYDNLISRLKLANEGSKERKDIIEAIKSGYGQYLNFIVDEKTSIEQLTTAYDDVVKSMKAKAAASTLEKGYMAIEESYASDITEARKELEKELSKGITVDGRPFIPTKQEIQDMFNLIQVGVANTDASLLQTSAEQRNFIQSIVQDYIGQGAVLSQDYTQLVGVVSLAVTKKEQELELEKNINSAYKETLKSRQANIELWQLENKLAADKNKINKTSGLSDFDRIKELKKIQEEFELNKIELKFKFGEISEAEKNKQKDSIINWATVTVASINEKIKSDPIMLSFGEEKMSSMLITKAEQEAGMSAVIENTISGYKTQTDIIDEQLRLKNAGLKIDESVLANALMQQSLYESRAVYMGIELNAIKKINAATVQSVNAQLPEEYWINIVDQQKSLETVISETNKKYNDATRTIELLNHQKAIGLIISEADLEKAEEAAKNYKETLRLLEPEKKKTTSSSKEDAMKARISIIKEAGKAYEEYLKYYDKETSKLKTQEAYKDAFKEAGIGGMTYSMDFDVSGVIAGLETLLKSATGKTRKLIQKELADQKAKVGIDVVIADTKEINKQFEDMFAGYELTIEMGKLGLDKETTAQLFNVDIFDTKQIRKKLEETKAADKAAGTERLEEYAKIDQKITDMEQKANIERLKEYSVYLKKSMSERVLIELEGQKKIAEIPKEFTAPQREQAKQTIQKETQKKLDKKDWEDFQSSDLYIRMFEDLEVASTRTLDLMESKLIELKSSLKELSPTELKEIQNQLEKIRDIKIERNPFGGLISGLREYLNLSKNKKELDEEYAKSVGNDAFYQKTLENSERALEQAKKEELLAKSKVKINKNGTVSGQEELYVATKKVASLSTEVTLAQKDLSISKQKTKELGKQKDDIDTANSKWKESLGKIGSHFTEMSSAIGDVAGSLENVFGFMSAGMRDAVESTQEILSGIGEIASGIAKGGISGYMQAAVGLFSTIGSIFAIGDKKKERQIQREIKAVEKLQETYEDLDKAIQDAYSFDTLKEGDKQMEANLKSQNESLRRMINAERDKKKTDQGKIDEWNKQIKDNNERIKENTETLIASFGGLGSEANVKSAAENFASAWLDSFNEVGDGMEGLDNSWDDFINNMMKKQLAGRLSSKYFGKLFDEFDDMFAETSAGGEDVVKSELDKLKGSWDVASEGFNEAAKKLMESLGLKPGGETGELSGLQKGIAGITEDTAQILESILSSLRMFVADSNLQLKNLYLAFSSGDITSNPMLAELRAQTVQVTAINRLLSAVIGHSHPTYGGDFLKCGI